jgi:putative SOS response-associated peptidase YedK
MCFTIHIRSSRDAIEKRFNTDASALRDFDFRYFHKAFENPALPVITQENPAKVALMNWGLIPHWARDESHAFSIRKGTYNARHESLADKPSFRDAYESGRCLIIANGFFEWQHIGKNKTPWFIQRSDQELFAIAGIYDRWRNPENGEERNTFSLVTTRANPLMEKIHNTKKRMPLILEKERENQWIEAVLAAKTLEIITKPLDQEQLKAHTVSKNLGTSSANPHSMDTIRKTEYFVDQDLFSSNEER